MAKKPKLTAILSALDTLIKPEEERLVIDVAQKVEDAVGPRDPAVHICTKRWCMNRRRQQFPSAST